MGLFGKELALNRPLQKASWPHNLDLFPLRVLDKCSPGDQAHASVTGIHIDTPFVNFAREECKRMDYYGRR